MRIARYKWTPMFAIFTGFSILPMEQITILRDMSLRLCAKQPCAIAPPMSVGLALPPIFPFYDDEETEIISICEVEEEEFEEKPFEPDDSEIV